MNTAFFQMVKYKGTPIIPAQQVCNDFFRHLTVVKLLRKISDSQIQLSVVRVEDSRESVRDVHLLD